MGIIMVEKSTIQKTQHKSSVLTRCRLAHDWFKAYAVKSFERLSAEKGAS